MSFRAFIFRETTTYWEPGVGREATVFVDHGQPRCVMASPYFARWKARVTS